MALNHDFSLLEHIFEGMHLLRVWLAGNASGWFGCGASLAVVDKECAEWVIRTDVVPVWGEMLELGRALAPLNRPLSLMLACCDKLDEVCLRFLGIWTGVFQDGSVVIWITGCWTVRLFQKECWFQMGVGVWKVTLLLSKNILRLCIKRGLLSRWPLPFSLSVVTKNRRVLLRLRNQVWWSTSRLHYFKFNS